MNMSKNLIRKLKTSIYIILITIGMSYTANAENKSGYGKPLINMRIRYENVDQKNALLEADALTIRTRVGYETPEFNNFKAYAEIENVVDIMDDYNSTRNGKSQYSVVADPDETEINQAFLSYKGLPNTEIKAGRQRIKLDNSRFIGNVGWRQLEQTYDAILIKNSSIPDTVVHYIYIKGAKNINSYDIDLDGYILNISYIGCSFGTLTGYGYILDMDDAPITSQETFGLRFSGGKQLSNMKILYTAEYAKQGDYEEGNNGIDSDYIFLEIGMNINPVTVKLGYENLGSDSFSGFETPLATKHAFNGWADQFLGTPSIGLEDTFISINANIHGINFTGVYHDFSSDQGNIDYGTEIDFSAVKKFGKHYSAGLKYADYNTDGFGVDTDKLWVWMEIKY